ncbi:MAG: hypothetical protein FJ087_01180 [Deltaproteobacteria bacterium]|nr:hypothetical protein [Deltaproteobacteria bacterium]
MSKSLLLLDLACPNCGEELTQGNRIRLNGWIRDTGQEGPVALSAVFGDYSIETDLDIPEGTVIDLRCPTCEQSLLLNIPCRQCHAPMASMDLKAGGYVEFCTRRGCRAHALGGAGDIDAMIGLVNRLMNTPHD